MGNPPQILGGRPPKEVDFARVRFFFYFLGFSESTFKFVDLFFQNKVRCFEESMGRLTSRRWALIMPIKALLERCRRDSESEGKGSYLKERN